MDSNDSKIVGMCTLLGQLSPKICQKSLKILDVMIGFPLQFQNGDQISKSKKIAYNGDEYASKR